MEQTLLQNKFQEMGARVKFAEPSRWTDKNFTIDVKRDKKGEYFEIVIISPTDISVLDLQKKDRHLLLMTKDLSAKKADKSKFLCGHDERSWFTCAIPEKASVSNVFQAKEALKPKILQDIEKKEGLKTKIAHKRHRKLESGKKIHRQGEFMFIPDQNFQPPKGLTPILKNEPMKRSDNSKPHMAEFLYRYGGTTVYMSDTFNEQSKTTGLTEMEFNRIQRQDRANARRHRWITRSREPIVHVKGKIRHSDHATLDLGNVWHKVVLNTEDKAKAKAHVVFID